ncbi:MAG: hypothetical protein JSS02_24190 [Planctomycetes bacterium]|nr:hypothetical protein [Planctomycetota bacterium]
MSTHDAFSDQPVPSEQPKKKSRALLIVGTVCGVMLLVCCGGGGFMLYSLFGKFVNWTTDSAEVKQRSAEVVEIEIPEKLKPTYAMRLSPGPFTMKMIIYGAGDDDQEGLVIMEMDVNQPNGDPKLMREQMLQQMRAQQGQGGGGGMNTQIVTQSKETRKFNINGEAAEFDFIKGNRPGDTAVIRQVIGSFKGRSGVVMLILVVPDSEYDEEAVIAMIKSIRVPGSDTATIEMTDDANSADKPTQSEPEMKESGHEAGGDEQPAANENPNAANPPQEAETEKPE